MGDLERDNLKKAGVGLSRVRGESWSFRGFGGSIRGWSCLESSGGRSGEKFDDWLVTENIGGFELEITKTL